MELGNFNKEESNEVCIFQCYNNEKNTKINCLYFLLQSFDNQNNGEWFINAEQFVATALTLQKMVEFIGQRVNISKALNELRNS